MVDLKTTSNSDLIWKYHNLTRALVNSVGNEACYLAYDRRLQQVATEIQRRGLDPYR